MIALTVVGGLIAVLTAAAFVVCLVMMVATRLGIGADPYDERLAEVPTPPTARLSSDAVSELVQGYDWHAAEHMMRRTR